METKRSSGHGPIDTLAAIVVETLPLDTGVPIDINPAKSALTGLAESLGVPAVRKLRVRGTIERTGPGTVVLTGEVGATVEQTCVVTLEPVTSRIDEPFRRNFEADLPTVEDDYQLRENEDVDIDRLGPEINLTEIVVETLALALPPYPRADGADFAPTQFAAPGVEPMTDEAARPFAALSALKEKLAGKT